MEKAYRILVVDAEADFAQAVKKSLEPDLKVILASSMGEGLLQARRETPDLVIVGYLEPRGASFEFHKKLREGRLTKDIPLLVVDVCSEERSRKGWLKDEGMQMDAEDYIARPIDPVAFKGTVDRILERVHARPLELELVLDQIDQIMKRINRIEGQLVN